MILSNKQKLTPIPILSGRFFFYSAIGQLSRPAMPNPFQLLSRLIHRLGNVPLNACASSQQGLHKRNMVQ